MNIQDIEKFIWGLPKKQPTYVKISFKKREPVYGLFVQDRDYAHLKTKNFWRIVTKMHFDEFAKTTDMSLARIFNGAEFSRLIPYAGSFE
ncbi:MAG TPA: short-chain dehydrogenase [Chitinophagaceae bacterium]|jgi:hypothetical protein|nr:short-chain dehydrogenase [Chitinophagaceae bacterium]